MNSMEITGFITSGLVSKVQDLVVDRIIGKWKAYRATKFFETLTHELTKEYSSKLQTNRLDEVLERILTKSEAEGMLFEAYRRVCLSTTKDLGPKIIAMLTARLLIEERIATEDEESIFILAEEMRDVEFMEFCNFFHKENLGEKLQKKSSYEYPISKKTLNMSSRPNSTPATHLTPIVMLGKWAGKLEKVGFLYADTESEVYMKNDFIKENYPIISYHFSVVFEHHVSALYEYVRRAQGPIE